MPQKYRCRLCGSLFRTEQKLRDAEKKECPSCGELLSSSERRPVNDTKPFGEPRKPSPASSAPARYKCKECGHIFHEEGKGKICEACGELLTPENYLIFKEPPPPPSPRKDAKPPPSRSSKPSRIPVPSHTPPHKRPAAPPPPPLPPAKEDTTGCFILAGILGVIVLVILCIKWPWLLVVASTLVTATLLYFAIRPAVRILKKHRSIILLTVSFGGMLAYYIYRLSCFMANTLNERTVEMKIGFSLAILWAVWLAALLFRRFVRP